MVQWLKNPSCNAGDAGWIACFESELGHLIYSCPAFGLRDSPGSSHVASSPGIGPKEVNDLPALRSP